MLASIEEEIFLDDVFSAFPVAVAGNLGSFSLYITETLQFVAYYDKDRQLCVISRSLKDQQITKVILPESTGWDSHNYITLALDPSGHVHVSGNMHISPLCYFLSTEPYNIRTLQRVSSMTRSNEREVSYPRFLHNAKGDLIFTYRDGRSGAGNQIYNVYDDQTKCWTRLHRGPLTDGEGKRNAYFQGPFRGPDGYFHLCWVWRETADASTTHTLNYARSPDLQSWETSDGTSIKLPMTAGQGDIVDPVGVNGGIINNNHLIGFDNQLRVVISYQKYDEFGNTQIYQARRESKSWVIYRTTDWEYRWDISGMGSLVFQLHFGALETIQNGRLMQWYRHARYGSGALILDGETMEVVGHCEGVPHIPPALNTVISGFPGMQVNWVYGDGPATDASSYMLRWETLPENSDLARSGALPEPTKLMLYKISRG